VTVEVRFRTAKDGQNAYRYVRQGAPSYGYVDYMPQYFTVWDVTSNPARQLSAAYVEQNASAAMDTVWRPTQTSGDREYLFIFNSTYTATPDPYFTSRNLNSQAGEFPTLYAWWPLIRTATDTFNPNNDQVLTIIPNFANTNVDVFDFNTASYKKSTSPAKERVSADKVGVFPNPYYAFNSAESNRFSRFVTFNNLPIKVKIRIFNLAGQLVRTLDKDDSNQFLQWDLNNYANFPVASGMYLAHVEMTLPADNSVISKVLKIAVIQEQEILNTY
jgi:hypothetical protein